MNHKQFLREVTPVWTFKIWLTDISALEHAYACKFVCTRHFWRLTKWQYNFWNFRKFPIISELGLNPANQVLEKIHGSSAGCVKIEK